MNMQQCILSILLLMDFWVVSRYWPWQIKLLRIRPYKILRRHILSFVLDKEPAVRLLGQKENAHLLLENKQPGHFVKVVVEFYTPTNDGMFGNCELFHNLANSYWGFSLFWWVCVSHGFNLHFSEDRKCWEMFMCLFGCWHSYLCEVLFQYFNWAVCHFVTELHKFFIILAISAFITYTFWKYYLPVWLEYSSFISIFWWAEYFHFREV